MWERWKSAWRVVFLALLACALLFAFSEPAQSDAWLILILSLLMAGWYFAASRVAHWRERLLPLFAYFISGWLLWYMLTSLNTAFFLLLFILFPHLFIIAPLAWAIALALVLNGLVLLQLYRVNSDWVVTWMLLLTLTSLGGSLLGYFINDIIRQSEKRRLLIAELEATRSHLAETQREAGILHERQRLAGELHDTITQGLVAVVMHLEAAENSADSETAQRIAQAKIAARDSLHEARRFIWEMRPPALEHHALVDALRYVVESWCKASALSGELVTTGDARPLSHDIELALLRVTQEALANVAKHAHAQRATVTLSYMPDSVVLDVNDNGRGFDGKSESGFGLINMRRRVEALSGTLTVESAVGEGTTVVAEIPLKGN
jgi:signal transduction histidine kinase